MTAAGGGENDCLGFGVGRFLTKVPSGRFTEGNPLVAVCCCCMAKRDNFPLVVVERPLFRLFLLLELVGACSIILPTNGTGAAEEVDCDDDSFGVSFSEAAAGEFVVVAVAWGLVLGLARMTLAAGLPPDMGISMRS